MVSGTTLAVGAYGEDSGAGSESGAVYVFVRTASGWAFEQKVTASDGSAGANFGYSVAISGETLAVGSKTFAEISKVYVLTRNAGVWAERQKILGPATTVCGSPTGHCRARHLSQWGTPTAIASLVAL